jgi:hypothetical protein
MSYTVRHSPPFISLSLLPSLFNNESRDDHLIATCPIIS